MRIKGVFLSAILAAVLCVSGNVLAVLSGGGTAANPYLIQSRADFDEFANPANATLYWASSKYTRLMCNLDLSGTTYTHAVIAWSTMFKGIFDGNSHTLSNLTISQPSNDYIGLFGYVGTGGNIRNLGVEEINLLGRNYVGGLAGYSNYGSVTGCYVTGSVSGSSYVGGLVGTESGGSLTACYATGSVSGSFCVGGLVGCNENYGFLTACYATGLVNGPSYVGGLIGANSNSNATTACFWDTQASGQSVGVGQGSSMGVVGKNTTEMKTVSTFSEAGWIISDLNGFDADWIISSDGQDYPKTFCFAYRDPSDTVPLLGEGTEQNPYQIGSPADLVSLSQYSSVWDKQIILTANVDMEGFTIRPIGNSILRFSGCFNGQDFVISNITMNLPHKDCVGLFGRLGNGGEITHLGVENVNIAGKMFVGGLVGYNSHGVVSHCHSTGLAAGGSSSSVGGLAGFNFGGTISNCSSSVSISGQGATLGGLVGNNFTGSTITHCSATGAIVDNDPATFGSRAGGLVGNNFNSTITHCLATGSVSVTSASPSASSNICIGGLVGENSYDTAISNSYATGNVHVISASSSATLCGGGLVGLKSSGEVNDCYAGGSVTFSCNTESGYFFGGLAGLTTEGSITRCYSRGEVGSSESAEADCCVGGLTGFNMDGEVYGCFWDIEAGMKVLSGGGRGLTTEQMKTRSIYQNAGWADKGWVIEDGQDYPRLVWEGTDGAAIPAPSAVALIGNGTAENPYQIWTAQDLEIWGQYASVLNQHTRLRADLDLTGVLLYPIGEYGPFTGTFDGDGHVIKNITITQPTNCYVGLFGRVGAGGVITDLTIQDAAIVGGDYVGGLIGSNEGGTIRNCSSTGTIGGLAYIGGLIGSNESGTVNQCYSDANVTTWGSSDSGSYAGGLVGYNGSGVLTSCCATGSVGGAGSTVGGLAGENHGTLTLCYATGSVSGGGSIVGGLVGLEQGTLTACYATGLVNGTSSFVGGLVGRNGGSTLSRCFWDIQTSGRTVGVGYGTSTGVTGISTAEMKTLSTFTSAGWDFSNTDGDLADWMMLRPGEDTPRLAWQPIIAGDIAGLYGVTLEDLDVFAQQWLMGNCSLANDFCDGADIDKTGIVNLADFSVLASHWQKDADFPIPMQGHWTLDDATGTVALDSSGNLRNGTLINGPVWTSSGKLNGALQFDGVNDYVSVVGYKGILGTSSRTCAAWIKTSGTTQNSVILGWGGQHWIFGLFGTGELTVYAGGPYIKTVLLVNDNQWHHVAAVMADDGSPNVSEITLYVDGLLQTTVKSPGVINTPQANDVLIGAFSAGTPASFFKGLIDDVRLYNMVLSEAQIEEIFKTE